MIDKETTTRFETARFKKFFLLELTKVLIKNSTPAPIIKLQKILENEGLGQEPSEEVREKVHDVMKAKEEEISIISKRKDALRENLRESSRPHLIRKNFPFQSFENVRLTIPDVNLPPRFDYLRPVPKEMSVDLKKLNPLIKDMNVRIIECEGAEQNVIVKGKMGEKKTPIVLNNDEINDIVNIFSKETKIPLHEGVYKVVLGNLIFLAIVSEVIGSKFIIRKMNFR